jgi:hypothetical protein
MDSLIVHATKNKWGLEKQNNYWFLFFLFLVGRSIFLVGVSMFLIGGPLESLIQDIFK